MRTFSHWCTHPTPWFYCFLLMTMLLGCVHLSACSTRQPTPPGELAGNANDLFNDPFFTDPPYWDNPTAPSDEQQAGKSQEPEKPKTLLQKGEDLAFTTFTVGISIAKMAIPFLGF